MRATLVLAGILTLTVGCSGDGGDSPAKTGEQARTAGADRVDRSEMATERDALVSSLRRSGIADPDVLAAIGEVPRHEFMPEALRALAYADQPLPIGHEQTISQPFVVALMSDLADVQRGDKVLEVGTGSGYQAAVLAELGADVYSIEIVEPLGRRAAADLQRLGYDVETRIGDGYRGWPTEAPFDAIVITAAPPEVPAPLLEQLAVGGRMVVPVGETGGDQELVVITRTADGFERSRSIPVRFVPMTGEAQER
ncbi:MAG: protein-L-isoaspartate(D-aspartate) O-methyltransferase [Myxococcota bacterium]|nr:protein-L-isoaspartate(D-aspartate) O-methyltransferase [Myxococcota bacterium]